MRLQAVGCIVKHGLSGEIGMVVEHGTNDTVKIQWTNDAATSEWCPVQNLVNGFKTGDIVQDIPLSNTGSSLGAGTVLGIRRMAGQEMVNIQLHNTGENRQLPYEHLRLVGGRRTHQDDASERFRMKAFAYALDSWHQTTGALDRFDVDPLPHQIDLVHRILTSDQRNWLIADDVGLGKTIEVGLLLAALKRRRQAQRVLIVCPAGIVRQWKDEMQYKFNENYQIYGGNFIVDSNADWANYDKVIVSIDRAKSELHSHWFRNSRSWDVIIFDEAHHLSKIPNQATTQRYGLAQQLRRLTDSFIFLTGTPHQGNSVQFINLLRLLRPDLSQRLSNIFTDPSIVADIVMRNRKSNATDANGEFLFRGQTTNRIEVQTSEAAIAFDDQLQQYLREGYAASEIGGTQGRAIGFVMTTYRKLASSSIAAIDGALRRRKNRLLGSIDSEPVGRFSTLETDGLYESTDNVDNLDEAADIQMKPFFENELGWIERLLVMVDDVKENDNKVTRFLSEVVSPVLGDGQKLLIFTEYRGTEEYLARTLQSKFPGIQIARINGSMSLDAKRASIDAFNADAQIMISTEAGGEGINLHEECHIMVNYDLPWNPGRLVQRSGRLYRYGQKHRVVVFNLVTTDSFDNRILGMMLDRVYSIARDMASVSQDYHEGIDLEIAGEIMERLDIASLLADNKTMSMQHSIDEIDEALERAKEAQKLQGDLFAKVEGYDHRTTVFSQFGSSDVAAFIEGILPFKGIEVRNRMYEGNVLELRLPEEMRDVYPEFGHSTVVRVVIDRRSMPNTRADTPTVPMDFASAFFADLVDFAKSPDFDGQFGCISGQETGILRLYRLRWQDDQGVPREESLLPVFLPEGSDVATPNPEFFHGMLLSPLALRALDGFQAIPTEVRRILDSCAEAELAARCTDRRYPNDFISLATARVL